jgi:putative component of membrane protein insertase Oxa1/YidC/SpoIIIJ protein YidD
MSALLLARHANHLFPFHAHLGCFMLKHLGLGLLAVYERITPVRKSECCAYRASSGRSPCFEFAKRAISRYGFFKGLALVNLRMTECAEAARALESSERRWRESLLAHPSVMSQFAEDAEDWDRGDTLPMQWDGKGNLVPRPVQAPVLEPSKLEARVAASSKRRIKVRARRCGPLVWPRQYSHVDSEPRHPAGLQPSH